MWSWQVDLLPPHLNAYEQIQHSLTEDEICPCVPLWNVTEWIAVQRTE